MRSLCRIVIASIVVMFLASEVISQQASAPKEKQMAEKKQMAETRVLLWVREAPLFGDNEYSTKQALDAGPANFPYEEWFARGRKLPGVVETIVEQLEKEDLQHPSGDGERMAYALGWVGDRRQRAIDALVRCLGSKDLMLRIEAVAALGRIGNESVEPLLESLVNDRQQDRNIRGNACVSIGRLGARTAEPVLRKALKAPDLFVVVCAQEGLKLLQSGRESSL
jgi:hypothetical protein